MQWDVLISITSGGHMSLVCKCHKGYASKVDNLCGKCREKLFSRSEGKLVGVKYAGDGMTLEQQSMINARKTSRGGYR